MKTTVYRPNTIDYTTIEADLVKKPGKGLGLSVVARKSGKGVYIADIVSILKHTDLMKIPVFQETPKFTLLIHENKWIQFIRFCLHLLHSPLIYCIHPHFLVYC